MTSGLWRYVAYCGEGSIGDYYRHSICREDVSNPDIAARGHGCFVEVIAHTADEAALKARLIADALNQVGYHGNQPVSEASPSTQSAAQKAHSQSAHSPAIDQAREQHLYAIGRFRVSGVLGPVIDTLDALIESSASRLQEVEAERDALKANLQNKP